jgi:hypothetical protein
MLGRYHQRALLGVVTFSIETDQGDVPEAFYEAEDGPTQ